MDLLIFDLDGTLLNQQSRVSPFTQNTLQKLHKKGIAYTVATGRTITSGHSLIAGHDFILPHIYSNGVVIWHPHNDELIVDNCLSKEEATTIIDTTVTQNITPFVSAIGGNKQHFIFYPPLRHPAEQRLLDDFMSRPNITVRPLSEIDLLENESDGMTITNVSMIGDSKEIQTIHRHINQHTQLIAYSGPAVEGNDLQWMDIHHSQANKGSAVDVLRKQLGASRIICFGDSDNDLSMFACADESYAPSNAKTEIKNAATDVIGHHHEDGVAQFLHERFDLA